MKKRVKFLFFQEMLTYLDVEGKTVTADAMHCQRETCRRIIQRKGDYLFGLKENQPSLLEDVRLFFEDQSNQNEWERSQTVEKNAGQIEKRICRKIMDISWLKEHKWPGLQSVFSIERIVEARGRHSREISYYISSRDACAKQLMLLAREHWKIESMHWIREGRQNCVNAKIQQQLTMSFSPRNRRNIEKRSLIFHLFLGSIRH